jgi:hypothetical protein
MMLDMDYKAFDVLMEHDPSFASMVAKAEALITKMSPAPPDLSTRGGAKKPPAPVLKTKKPPAPKTPQPYGVLQPTKNVKTLNPPKPVQPKRQATTSAASMAKSLKVKGALAATGLTAYGGTRLTKKKSADYARGAKLVDNSFGKSDGFNIAKLDEDKRQVFGWASVISKNGVPVEDRQGDVIDPEELEKSAYEFVLKSRKGGHQHKRNGDEVYHVSDMIESMVVTDEKKEAMGLPDDAPTGWWVGFKVHDDDTWHKIKKGDVTGFSIHGRGKRKPLD